MMIENLYAMLFTFIGALVQEILHWYGLRQKLSSKLYRNILTSYSYWVITFLVVIITPVAVVIWFHGKVDALNPGDFLILGVAFPTLFKSIVARVNVQDEVKLGKDSSNDQGNGIQEIPLSKMTQYLLGR